MRPRYLANPADDLGFDDAFMARLLAEPSANGVVMLDPIKSFAGKDTRGLLAADGIHPNQRGELELHSAILGSFLTGGFAKAKKNGAPQDHGFLGCPIREGAAQ
jgi:hypothetical protein